jgi:drug/metabolite transporter (DMT)-like permease
VLLFVLLALRREDWRVRKGDWWKVIGLGLLTHSLYQVLFINGIARTTAGNTAMVLASRIILVPLISSLLALERPGLRVWLGALLTFTGTCLISARSAEGQSLNEGTVVGDSLVLLAAIVLSVAYSLTKSLSKHYSPLKLNGLLMAVGTALMIPYSLPQLMRQDWGRVSATGWLGVAYSGGLALALGHTVLNLGIERIGVARTTVFASLQPVVAVIVSWLALDEQMLPLQFIGTAAILSGICLARPSPVVATETRAGDSTSEAM